MQVKVSKYAGIGRNPVVFTCDGNFPSKTGKSCQRMCARPHASCSSPAMCFDTGRVLHTHHHVVVLVVTGCGKHMHESRLPLPAYQHRMVNGGGGGDGAGGGLNSVEVCWRPLIFD